MPSPTLANLEQRLRNAEARAQQLLFNTWVLPMSARHYKTPHLTTEYTSHTNLVTRVIPNLRRQIANKRARNARRAASARGWNAVRKHVKTAGIVKYILNATMRPPTRGGAGYHRLAPATSVGRKRTRNAATSPRRSPKIQKARSA